MTTTATKSNSENKEKVAQLAGLQFHRSSQSPHFLSLLHLSRHILLVFEMIVIVLIVRFFFYTFWYLDLCLTVM